jgi:hypothetical protein
LNNSGAKRRWLDRFSIVFGEGFGDFDDLRDVGSAKILRPMAVVHRK